MNGPAKGTEYLPALLRYEGMWALGDVQRGQIFWSNYVDQIFFPETTGSHLSMLNKDGT